MAYSLIDFSATEIEFNDGLRNYYYKKCYCSVELQAEYIIFTAHRVENNAFRQQWSVAYTDFTTPTGSAATVLAAIKAIIENYAGGGTGVTSVTGTSPITSSGGATPSISTSMATNKLIGRGTAGTGVMEEITVGSGLSLSGTTLSNTATPTPTGYYGAFQDVTNQTAAVINTGYPMKLGVTDLSNGVTIVSNSRITIANTGIYNIQWSGQFTNPLSAEHDVTVWLRKNGVDVPGSAGVVLVPPKHGSSDGHTLPSWNFLLDVVAGDYYEFVWSTANTSVYISFAPAGSPPPSTASVVLTVTQQSGIMAGTGITAINSLTGAAQTIVAGTSGTDFAISSAGTAHTFNLPTASATNRGALSTSNWSTFNGKATSPWDYRKTGRWWTPSNNALSIGSLTNVANSIKFQAVIIDRDITITQMGVAVVAIATASQTCRIGIYSNDPTTTQPLTRLVDSGTLALDSTGTKTVTGLSVVLTKGLYWFCYFSNATTGTIASVANLNMPDVIGVGASLQLGIITGYSQSLTYTSLPSSVGTLTNSLSQASSYCTYYYY